MAKTKTKKLSAAAMKKLQGTFGKENLSNVNDADIEVSRTPSGSMDLDRILGGTGSSKGYPKGRVIEIYGPGSAGKSSVATAGIVEAQNVGELAAYVDMEATYVPAYGASLGVNNDTLIYAAPESGEAALNMVSAFAETGEVGFCVLDSSNACTPQSEIDGDIEDQTMAVQARMFSKFMRKIVPACKKSGMTLIIISQIRDKIGGYGDPRAIGVGNAIFFADSIRLEVLPSKPVERNGEPYGHIMRFYTVKNKTHRPKLRGEAFFEYYKGFNKVAEILSLAVSLEIVKQGGSWFSYGDTKLGQGKENIIALLEDNPELFEEIEKLVLKGMAQQK